MLAPSVGAAVRRASARVPAPSSGRLDYLPGSLFISSTWCSLCAQPWPDWLFSCTSAPSRCRPPTSNAITTAGPSTTTLADWRRARTASPTCRTTHAPTCRPTCHIARAAAAAMKPCHRLRTLLQQSLLRPSRTRHARLLCRRLRNCPRPRPRCVRHRRLRNLHLEHLRCHGYSSWCRWRRSCASVFSSARESPDRSQSSCLGIPSPLLRTLTAVRAALASERTRRQRRRQQTLASLRSAMRGSWRCVCLQLSAHVPPNERARASN